ncbi:MAG: type II secretion system protein [Candidatus Saccharimonadia bacterium]
MTEITLNKQRSGFTLIELVIVLAIAALIILVVLEAVGAAQRSQRDSARKNEAGRFVSLLEQYASNNGGNYPTVASGLWGAPVGAALTAALSTYDANLSAKYSVDQVGATVILDPGYVTAASAGWATAGCATGAGATHPTDDVLIYRPQTISSLTDRDYDLAVCLESGGNDMVHPSN